ncbi:hypothetical protein EKE94_03390 [Mesobaculum littorinae]|uniref:TfoX N-terminal domain-containing protein n=2 Tax=Mesobaculum littorinae TaxID=2486419 RepID=A0A438ALK7_9RHOB|nr:hypothetical protein EKE94_03390 [Mesobaculum littorinae]
MFSPICGRTRTKAGWVIGLSRCTGGVIRCTARACKAGAREMGPGAGRLGARDARRTRLPQGGAGMGRVTMAWDRGHEALMRWDLEGLDIRDKRMFGGLCFMLDGAMLCGLMRAGGLYRPGKAAQAAALALPDVAAMEMGGRRMGGYVVAGEDAMADDALRAQLLEMSLACLRDLRAA